MDSWDKRLLSIIKHTIVCCLALAVLCPLFRVAESGRSVADAADPDDFGVVTATMAGPAGDSATVQMKLFRVIDGLDYEYAYSDNGTIEAKIPPGSYVICAYDDGSLLARTEMFEVARYDHKYVVVELDTIHIQGFVVRPEYRDSGALSQVRIDHSIVNLGSGTGDVEVRLLVTKDGALLEAIPIMSYHPLLTGIQEWQFYYKPANGWARGEYGFSLELYVHGELYDETDELAMTSHGGSGLAAWLWILFVILGVLVAAGLGFLTFFLWKRKRRKGEKPVRAEKERREEKAAPALEEATPSPEPAPSAEPVHPMEEPTRKVGESIAQPAPLSSVSTLKTRMATLGRDQGIVQETDKEPDSDNAGSLSSALKGRMASLDRNRGPVKDTDKGPDADSKGLGEAGK
jgi:hypothetical protein